MSDRAPRPAHEPRRTGDPAPPRDRVVVEERRSNPVARFLGGTLKAVLWMLVGVIVAVAIILALIF